MFVTIEVLAGPDGRRPTKADFDGNIAALERAIDGKPLAKDDVFMADTRSILEGIREKVG